MADRIRGEAEFYTEGSFERYFEHVPAAFAVTQGREHTLVYANAAFRGILAPDGESRVGRAIAEAFAQRDATGVIALLDRAFRTGLIARNRRIGSVEGTIPPLICTVWPELDRNGDTEHLVIELRSATREELTLGIQRELTERLLLSGLRQQDAADVAEVLRRSAIFLAAESRRLTESLDEGATLAAMERMTLPYVGDWCFVDIIDHDDTMHRLAIVHPDPAKQAILENVKDRWVPGLDDAFGLPAALRNAKATVLEREVDEALANSTHDPELLAALRELGVGPLLTVPLVIRERLIGAVTFVGGRDGLPFTEVDMEMAEDLAVRGAVALDRARLYGEAVSLRVQAESANEAKSTFLSMMSHELRTPLNAIGGYADLMDMEIHGPVTPAQHVDLARIRSNQRYLMGLITDLLNLTQVDSGQLVYHIDDFVARDILASSASLVEPLIAQKLIDYDGIACDASVVARGDPEKVTQILVNLLSNAIKFTPPGGRLTIDCEATQDAVLMRISDTGLGIPNDKLELIFDPFIQVKTGSLSPESGIGLGLAISRDLARAMNGEITVESTLGEGACFTLRLPRSSGGTL